jgi:hypothetical protein
MEEGRKMIGTMEYQNYSGKEKRNEVRAQDTDNSKDGKSQWMEHLGR